MPLIYAELAHWERYTGLGPGFQKAFAFLQANPALELLLGRHTIDGDAVFANVGESTTRIAEELILENHRRYVDLQLVVSGQEAIWCNFTPSLRVHTPYDAEKDIEFYRGAAQPIVLQPGQFLLLWPGEAHAPGIAAGQPSLVKKAVVKIQVAQ